MRNVIILLTIAVFLIGFSTCGNKQKEENNENLSTVVSSDEQVEAGANNDGYPEINMICSGTEPFWSAELTNKKVVLDVPDDNSVEYEVVSISPPAARPFGLVDVFELKNEKGEKAQLIIRSIFEEGCACSDGMSDNKYSAYALFISEGAGILEGCAENKEE